MDITGAEESDAVCWTRRGQAGQRCTPLEVHRSCNTAKPSGCTTEHIAHVHYVRTCHRPRRWCKQCCLCTARRWWSLMTRLSLTKVRIMQRDRFMTGREKRLSCIHPTHTLLVLRLVGSDGGWYGDDAGQACLSTKDVCNRDPRSKYSARAHPSDMLVAENAAHRSIQACLE